MMSDVRINFDASANQVLAEFRKLQTRADKLRAELKALGKESVKGSRLQKQGMQGVMKMTRQIATGNVKVDDALKQVRGELQRVRKTAKAGGEVATKATMQYRRELQHALAKLRQVRDGSLSAADASVELKRGLAGVGREMGNVARKSTGAFGARPLANMAKWAGSLGIGATAMAAFVKGLRDAQKIRDEAGSRIVDKASGLRAFRQVATSDAAYEKLVATAERMRTRHGMEAGPAYATAFKADSAGEAFVKDIKLFADLKHVGVNPEIGIDSVVTMQAAHGGSGAGTTGAGSSRAVINKLFAAAGPSKVSIDKIASAASLSGLDWNTAGGGDEGQLAMISVLTSAMKSADMASERVAALSRKLVDNKARVTLPEDVTFESLGPMGVMDHLAGWEKKGHLLSKGGESISLNDWLADASAKQAYRGYIMNRDDIRQRTKEIQAAEASTGTKDDIFAQRLGYGTKRLAAIDAMEASKQRLQVQEEGEFGNANVMATTVQTDFRHEMRADGVPELVATAVDFGLSLDRMVLGDQWLVDLSQRRVASQMQAVGVPEGMVRAIVTQMNHGVPAKWMEGDTKLFEAKLDTQTKAVQQQTEAINRQTDLQERQLHAVESTANQRRQPRFATDD